LNAVAYKDFVAAQLANPNDNKVRVTNKSAGATADAVNFDLGAPFAISVTQQGTGIGNRAMQDGDSLTLAIKKLDKAMGDLALLLDEPSYDEAVFIVASGATPPTSLNGPVAASTAITLPDNSRLGGLPQYYTVGKGALEVYLNGQYLALGEDWSEIGVSLAPSNQIQILQELRVGDRLEFRIDATGGPGGGSGGFGPQGPPGPTGPSGADAAGGPVAISTKIADYTVLTSDNVLLADCSSGSVRFTLPPAAVGVGHVFYFKKIDASANPMIIDGNGTELIDEQLTQQSTVQFESFTLVTDGVKYWIL
jgi:hypothetical protein